MSNILTDWLKDNRPKTDMHIFYQGLSAFMFCGKLEDNPYQPMTGNYIDWKNGFLDGEYRAKTPRTDSK